MQNELVIRSSLEFRWLNSSLMYVIIVMIFALYWSRTFNFAFFSLSWFTIILNIWLESYTGCEGNHVVCLFLLHYPLLILHLTMWWCIPYFISWVNRYISPDVTRSFAFMALDSFAFVWFVLFSIFVVGAKTYGVGR